MAPQSPQISSQPHPKNVLLHFPDPIPLGNKEFLGILAKNKYQLPKRLKNLARIGTSGRSQ